MDWIILFLEASYRLYVRWGQQNRAPGTDQITKQAHSLFYK